MQLKFQTSRDKVRNENVPMTFIFYYIYKDINNLIILNPFIMYFYLCSRRDNGPRPTAVFFFKYSRCFNVNRIT